MFKPVACDFCRDCLTQCLWMTADQSQAQSGLKDKAHSINAFFELCGVTRLARTYDRKNAMGCAAVKMMLSMGAPRADHEKNIPAAKSVGAQAMVCLCPMRMHSIYAVAQEQNFPLIFLGDVERMALGDLTPPTRP